MIDISLGSGPKTPAFPPYNNKHILPREGAEYPNILVHVKNSSRMLMALYVEGSYPRSVHSVSIRTMHFSTVSDWTTAGTLLFLPQAVHKYLGLLSQPPL